MKTSSRRSGVSSATSGAREANVGSLVIRLARRRPTKLFDFRAVLLRDWCWLRQSPSWYSCPGTGACAAHAVAAAVRHTSSGCFCHGRRVRRGTGHSNDHLLCLDEEEEHEATEK